jgi:arylsulfatase A-like enzyme
VVRAGAVSHSLVSTVDLAPTIAEIAEIPRQSTYEGQSILPILKDASAQVREFVFAEDHWHDFEDHARSVGNQRFKLIRNDYPDLPATPPADALRSPTWQVMRRLHAAGRLAPAQLKCFESPRAKYELYDLLKDPGELENLATDPEYQATLDKMSNELERWAKVTNDYIPSRRTPDEFNRLTGEPIHSVRVRPRRSKKEMFGTDGKY